MGMGIDKAGKKYMVFQAHLLISFIVSFEFLGIKGRTQFHLLRKNIDNSSIFYDNGHIF